MLQRTGTPRRLLGNNIRGASYFTSSYTEPDIPTMNTAGGTPVFVNSSFYDNTRRASRGRTVTSQSQTNTYGITQTPPGFYQPQHTPSAWQIPTNRTEVYKWCLSPDTLVTMSNFTQKRIAEIVVGDKILAGDGTVAEVSITSKRKYKGLLKQIDIVGTNGSIEATPDHIFYRVKSEDVGCRLCKSHFRFCRPKYICVSEKCDDHLRLSDKVNIEEVRADQLEEGDFLYSPTNILANNRSDFTPDFMRLLGYYLAEGHIKFYNRGEPDRPNAVAFSFGEKEKDDLVADCVNIIKNEFDYEAKIYNKPSVLNVQINSVKIAQQIYELCGCHAQRKVIAPIILEQNVDLLRELVIGYILGDGNRLQSGGIQIKSVNFNLLSQVRFILQGMGLAPRIGGDTKEKEHHKVGISHQLLMNIGDANKLFEHSLFNNHKTEYAEQQKNNNKSIIVGDLLLHRIKSIKDMEFDDYVYDMRVDNESGIHRFLANFVVVSNCSYWISNEGRIAMAIDFFSDFPMNHFELDCPNAAVKEYFENMIKKIALESFLPKILREYFGMGDAFVMMEIDCPKCKGQGMTEGGEECDHTGASWSGISILDPLTVEVIPVPLSPEAARIYLTPNNELKKLVQDNKPKDVVARIPEHLKKLVRSNQKIPLDPLTITHFKHGAPPYATYGVPLIRRLFPTLAYKDKLRQAQWIVAERHIVPIKIVKIGSDNRPASQQDIDDLQARLAEIANDPIATLVTYHDFDYEYVGACYSSDTEVLTKNGFKKYTDILEDDNIACYNPENNKLEYYKYEAKYIYDYNSETYGPMININGKHYDSLVTPNHMLWIKKRKWNKEENRYDFKWMKVRADEIQEFDKVLSSVDWAGSLLDHYPYTNIDILKDIQLNDFVRFIGYYIAEGSQQRSSKENKLNGTTYIYQKENTNSYYKILSNVEKCFKNKYKTSINNEKVRNFKIHDIKLSRYLVNEFGIKSYGKKIPQWMLDLPQSQLSILLDALMDGDGDIVTCNNKSKNRYSTTSKELADNVQEILIKLGYNPKVSMETIRKTNKTDTPLPIYRIYWPETKQETREIRSRNISKESYNDIVWCLQVPTGLFITKRNGKIGIHGNSGKVLQLTNEVEQIENEMVDGLGLTKAILSGEGPTYSNAQVAVEIVIKRLESVRNLIANWLEEKVFKPVAEFNGFTHKNRRGETEYIYPTIRWDDLKLRDNSQKLQFMWQARTNGDLSARTFIEEGLGLDMDNEIENMRLEEMSEMFASPNLGLGAGSGDVAGGGYGGGGPVMPPAMGGGMPEGGDMGGMPPGAEGGMPGGAMGGAPGGAPGGTPGGAPAAATANVLSENYRTVVAASQHIGTMVRTAGTTETMNVFLPDMNRIVDGNGARGELPEEADVIALLDITPTWGAPGYPLSYLYASNANVYDKIITKHYKTAGLMGTQDPKQKDKNIGYKPPVTSIEAKLYQAIMSQNYPLKFFMQYLVNGNHQFRVDGAFPDIKVAVEADGETWHIDDEKVQKDRYRDTQLASQGWLVLRFTEDEIEEKMQDVVKVITNAINQKSQPTNRAIAQDEPEMTKQGAVPPKQAQKNGETIM